MTKLSEILVKTQYLNLMNEKIFNRMFAEKSLSERNQNNLLICQSAAVRLSAKIDGFLTNVRVKRILERGGENTGVLA